MIPDGQTVVEAAATGAVGMIMLGLFLAFFRLVRGPSLPDRVVALDLVATLSVGLIAAYDVYTHQPVFLDAAIVVALVAFLATVAFAIYLQRRQRDE